MSGKVEPILELLCVSHLFDGDRIEVEISVHLMNSICLLRRQEMLLC